MKMIDKNSEISLSIIPFGRTTNSVSIKEDILSKFILQKRADSDKYADQQQVFEKVGLQILSDAWQGYHCSLFAYGQTGAGKSYSMVGYGANAKEFQRNISMSVKMMLMNSEGEDGEIDMKKHSIKIKVVNRQVGYSYWWNVDKLSNRYYIIKDMSQQYFETGIIPQLEQKDDPFWDPPEHSLIGRGFLTTKALTYMLDNLVQLPIIGEDDHCGELTVNLFPTDETGKVNLCQEMDDQVQFEPQQLLDKPFYFNLMIEEAKIPPNFQNIFVQYSLKTDENLNESFRTPQINQKAQNPKFNYIRLHKFSNVNENILRYLTTAKVIYKIYGYQKIPEQKKQTKKETKKQESDITKAKKEAESKEKKAIQNEAIPVTPNKNQQISSNKTHQPKATVQSQPNTTQPQIKQSSRKPNASNTIPKRGKDEKDFQIC